MKFTVYNLLFTVYKGREIENKSKTVNCTLYIFPPSQRDELNSAPEVLRGIYSSDM
jgi:hypothetical protein